MSWDGWRSVWLRRQTPLKQTDSKTRLSADFTAAGRMPKILRAGLPQALLLHLLARMRQRGISADQITELARWMDTEPEVPNGKWLKIFSGFTVCGDGELVKTFLLPGQVPE